MQIHQELLQTQLSHIQDTNNYRNSNISTITRNPENRGKKDKHNRTRTETEDLDISERILTMKIHIKGLNLQPLLGTFTIIIMNQLENKVI